MAIEARCEGPEVVKDFRQLSLQPAHRESAVGYKAAFQHFLAKQGRFQCLRTLVVTKNLWKEFPSIRIPRKPPP
jgi:hypothetical protein